jgi:predicted DNA-binding ribbon-helix-helix protein
MHAALCRILPVLCRSKSFDICTIRFFSDIAAFLTGLLGRNGSCVMKYQIVTYSFVIAGRKKSISLEEAVWRSLKEIATYRDMTLAALLGTIYPTRNQERLSSVIRLFVLDFYREQLALQDRYDTIETVLCGSIRLH